MTWVSATRAALFCAAALLPLPAWASFTLPVVLPNASPELDLQSPFFNEILTTNSLLIARGITTPINVYASAGFTGTIADPGLFAEVDTGPATALAYLSYYFEVDSPTNNPVSIIKASGTAVKGGAAYLVINTALPSGALAVSAVPTLNAPAASFAVSGPLFVQPNGPLEVLSCSPFQAAGTENLCLFVQAVQHGRHWAKQEARP